MSQSRVLAGVGKGSAITPDIVAETGSRTISPMTKRGRAKSYAGSASKSRSTSALGGAA